MPIGRHTGHRAPSIADKARSARASRTAADLPPIIAELRAAGITSLKGIAKELNIRVVLTPTGRRYWYTSQVTQLLRRLAGVNAQNVQRRPDKFRDLTVLRHQVRAFLRSDRLSLVTCWDPYNP